MRRLLRVVAELVPRYPVNDTGLLTHHTQRTANMKRYRIVSEDGTIEFWGRKVALEGGAVRLPNLVRVRLTVTIYVTDRDEGVVRQDVKIPGRTTTFVNIVRPGTSPEWKGGVTAETKLLNRAWARACAAEPSLRPVREWKITSDFTDIRTPTGPDTHLCVRIQRPPARMQASVAEQERSPRNA